MALGGGFRLEKWYLDVVADDGEAVLGYSVKLRYGLLRLSCGALLHAAPGEAPRTATQLTGLDLPEERGGVLHWTSPPCDAPRGGPAGASRKGASERRVRGTWTAELTAPELLLLDGPAGAVRWHPVQLRSAVRLVLPGGRTLAGHGYAERMELTIAPWQLPLRELRWARFLGPGAALAWIDWRGSHPLTRVLDAAAPTPGPPRMAALVPGASVSDDAVELPDGGRLSFGERVTLRDGTLGGDALRSVPLLRALPTALLGTHETTWLSRGTLERAGGRVEGWTIHELVRFPAGLGGEGADERR